MQPSRGARKWCWMHAKRCIDVLCRVYEHCRSVTEAGEPKTGGTGPPATAVYGKRAANSGRSHTNIASSSRGAFSSDVDATRDRLGHVHDGRAARTHAGAPRVPSSGRGGREFRPRVASDRRRALQARDLGSETYSRREKSSEEPYSGRPRSPSPVLPRLREP